MSNTIKLYIKNSLYAAAIMLSSGTVIQIFMTNAGVGHTGVSIFTALISVITVSVNMFLSRFADNVPNIKQTITKILCLIAICFFGFLPPCFAVSENVRLILTRFLLIPVGILQAVFIALYTIFQYKLPYKIIDIKKYGEIYSISGIVSNAVCLGISFLLTEAIERFDYYNVMLVAFAVSAAFVFIASAVNSSFKEKDVEIPVIEKGSMKDDIVRLIKLPSFHLFILPNFLRGVSVGIISILAVIAMDFGYGNNVTVKLVTVTYFAIFFGSFLYSLTSKIISDRMFCLIGAISIVPIMFIRGQTDIMFLLYCFFILIGRTFVDYAVPARTYQFVEIEIAGMYHAWRLLLNSAGTSISVAVGGVMMKYGMTQELCVIAFISQLISSMFYFLIVNVKKKVSVNQEEELCKNCSE